jgi:adenylate kinase
MSLTVRRALGLALLLGGSGLGVSAQTVVSPIRAGVVSVPVMGAALPVLAAPASSSLSPSLLSSAASAVSYAAPAYAAPASAPAAAAVPSAPISAAPEQARPLRLLITGPPGVGKTTFGKLLARDYGMIHISVGELLRAKADADPELAAIMSRGDLVDSELVRRVVTERLSQPDVAEHGFILDGFPRRVEEAGVIESWIRDGGVIDAMVHLEASDSELMRRILARGRMDDSEEVFRKRMEIYRRQTRPVLERFRQSLKMLETDASGPDISDNYAKVRAQIEELLAGTPGSPR